MGQTRRLKKPKKETGHRAVVGIDPSLSGHAIALMIDGKLRDYRGWTETKKLQQLAANEAHLCQWKMPTDKERKDVHRQYRIANLACWTLVLVESWHRLMRDMMVLDGIERPLSVAIEGYAFSKRSTGLSDIHELCGAIKTGLWQQGVPLRIYDPMSLKMAWTADGHAEKEDMIKAAHIQHPGLDLSSYGAAGDNLADAILLASLLDVEMSVREGYKELKDLGRSMRGVLLRTTKASPVALVSRPLIHPGEAAAPEPVSSSVGM